MKSSIFTACTVVLLSLPALARESRFRIGQSECGPDYIHSVDRVKYSADANGKVSVDVRLMGWAGTANPIADDTGPSYEEHSLGVARDLVVEGDQIVDHATGAVCAELKKPLIGARSYKTTKGCKVETYRVVRDVVGIDGEASGKQCTRDFYIFIRQ